MKKHDSLLKLISLIIVSTFLWSSFASAAGYPLAAERNCLAAASQVPVITPQARVMAAGQKAVVELPIGSPAEFYCQARSALRAGTISDFLGSKSLLMTDMADGSKTAAYTVEPHSAGGRALSRITRTREVNDPLIQLIMSCWPGFNFAVRQFSKGGQTYFQQIIVIDNQLADSFFQSLLNLLAERLGEVRPHSLIQQDSGLAARAMNRENQNPQLQPFGPTGWYPEYYSLADYFDSSYEMSLELTTREIKHKKEDPDADKRKFARMIVHCLKDLDTITSNGPLEEYWQTLTGRADNQNLVIKVNDRLTHNCVRYFNPISKQTEFVFSKNFVDTLVNDYEEYPGEVLVVLLERFFHELGHTGLTSYYQTLEEEYQLLKMDIELQKNLAAAELQEAVSNYFSVRQPSFVSGYYFGLIQMLVDHELREDTDESILALFDRLIATVAALEGELNELYLSADEYAIDKDSSEARDKRIQLAYEETDPEKAGSLINRLRQLPWLQGTFLATYLGIFSLFREKKDRGNSISTVEDSACARGSGTPPAGGGPLGSSILRCAPAPKVF